MITERPDGYPYILFSSNGKHVVAATERDALSANKQQRNIIFPVSISSLVQTLGHSKTHNLLKTFGTSWVCKNGNIFYSSIVRV